MSFFNMRKTLLVAVLTLAAGHAAATPFTGSIVLDTSLLADPFEIAFVLTDGSGSNDGNTAVTLDNFAFAGGSTGLCGSRGMEPLRGSIVTGGAAIQSGRTAEKRRCVRRGSTQSGAGGEMRAARRQAAGRGATAGGCGFP